MFNLFKQKQKTFCGINFEENFDFQIIEVTKKNNSFFSIYHKNASLNKILQKKIFKKQDFIKYFKKLKKEIESDSVNIFLKENKKLKKEIESALKIVGFNKINFVKNKNILGILLDDFSPYKKIIFYFTKKRVYFFEIENNKISNLDEISIFDFSYKSIKEFTKNKNVQEIFISGDISNKIDIIKEILYLTKIKVKFLNTWKNFLDFSDNIPNINLIDSYDFIDVLSITIPNLKKQPILGEKTIKTDNIILLNPAAPKISIKRIINHNKKLCYDLDVDFIGNKTIFLPKNTLPRKIINKIKLFLKQKSKTKKEIKQNIKREEKKEKSIYDITKNVKNEFTKEVKKVKKIKNKPKNKNRKKKWKKNEKLFLPKNTLPRKIINKIKLFFKKK